jgi:hypothetical protein
LPANIIKHSWQSSIAGGGTGNEFAIVAYMYLYTHQHFGNGSLFVLFNHIGIVVAVFFFSSLSSSNVTIISIVVVIVVIVVIIIIIIIINQSINQSIIIIIIVVA